MAYDSPHGLIAAAVIVQTLVIVMIIFRFISNRKRAMKFHVSDYLIIIAGTLSTALAIDQAYAAATGVFGVRLAPLMKSDPKAVPHALYILRQHNYSFVVIGVLAVGAIKISVSFFYLQIFSTQNYRPFIIAWIIFMTLWTVSFFTAFMAICGDHGIFDSMRFINPKTQAQECGNTRQLDFGVLISGTVSDLITVLIPVPMVLALHLRLPEKLSIVCIFLVGLLSVGASTARSYIGIYTKFAPKDKIMDTGLGVTATCVWTLVEIQVGILAACAPTIRPMMRDLVQSGVFSGLLSSARSMVSRKSSGTNLSGSGISRSRGGVRRSLSTDDGLPLHDVYHTTASAEHTSDVETMKKGAIQVTSQFGVDERAK